jgi:uncharacterized membrane protein
MPEKEFELYLAMLARMLRLNESQRASVADELRDHLETRLSELQAAGHSRDEAIHLALEDMGDAAGLATRLSTVGAIRRRRMIVRGTLVSACVLFVGLLSAGLFTPQHAPLAPVFVPAQAPGIPAPSPMPMGAGGGATAPAVVSVPRSPADDLRRKTETKLEEICPSAIEFQEVPSQEALGLIAEMIGLAILVDRRAIDENEFMPDQPVSLKLPEGSVTFRTALDLLLKSSGSSSSSLAFVAKDGVLYLTNQSESLIVDVYNVRDLIGQAPGHAGGDMSAMSSMPGMMSSMPGMMPMNAETGPPRTDSSMARPPRYTRVQGFPGSVATPPGAPGAPGMAPGMGMPGGGGGAQGGGPVATVQGQPLVAMIVEVLEPEVWSTQGGSSSIAEVDGLLVVRTTSRMHRSLTDLLSKMRSARAEGPGGPQVPVDGQPHTH